jgi:alcohol dehydrogenase
VVEVHALVFEGPAHRVWREVPDPQLTDSGDAIVRVDAVTICGTDLHILKGDVPETPSGTVLGHEAVGTVVEVGTGVRRVQVGDRVLISCISSCAACPSCRAGAYGQCEAGGGWILGHTINGTQAELVRVPYADTSTYPIPQGLSDEEVLMLADILPTSFEVGVRNGEVQPGDAVAIVGAGPIGLAAVMTAQLYTPGVLIVIDPATSRLDLAKSLGADVVINPETDDAVERVREITDGRGADTAIEAVGIPETFELCARLIRPRGRLANVGVHGKPATLHLEELWARDVTIRTGLVDTNSTPMLLELLRRRRLSASALVTHRFALWEAERAYDIFERPKDTGAVKVAMFREVH